MKKFLALILCIATLFSVFSFAVNAESSEESTTAITEETDNTTDISEKSESKFTKAIKYYFSNIADGGEVLITSLAIELVVGLVPILNLVAPLYIPLGILKFLGSFIGIPVYDT